MDVPNSYLAVSANFVRYTTQIPGWTTFFLQNTVNFSWHRYNKVPETFLRGFAPH